MEGEMVENALNRPGEIGLKFVQKQFLFSILAQFLNQRVILDQNGQTGVFLLFRDK